jgi:hypothetical protein
VKTSGARDDALSRLSLGTLPRLAGKANVRAKEELFIDGKLQVMNTSSWQNFVADQRRFLMLQPWRSLIVRGIVYELGM